MSALYPGVLVRAKKGIRLLLGNDQQTVPKGTYGLVRYMIEGAVGVLWLLPEDPICIEVLPSVFEVHAQQVV